MPNAATLAPTTSTVRARCWRWCVFGEVLRQRRRVQSEADTGN